jgi:hypothetical protein
MIKHAPIGIRIGHLVARLFFRGIYFPQMSKRAWLKLLFDNRKAILGLSSEGLRTWQKHRRRRRVPSSEIASTT